MNIGEVWRLRLGRFPQMDLVPPHTENWNMISKEPSNVRIETSDIRELILANVRPPLIQPSALFDGQAGFYENGKVYVDVNDNDLTYSVGFWRFNIPLYLDYDNNENEDGNYYHSESGDFRVRYTGVGNPENRLLPGTILRFFLSQSYPFMGRHVTGCYCLAGSNRKEICKCPQSPHAQTYPSKPPGTTRASSPPLTPGARSTTPPSPRSIEIAPLQRHARAEPGAPRRMVRLASGDRPPRLDAVHVPGHVASLRWQ